MTTTVQPPGQGGYDRQPLQHHRLQHAPRHAEIHRAPRVAGADGRVEMHLDRHGFSNADSWLDEYKRIHRLFEANLR